MGCRLWVAEHISKLTPFRFDTKIKKLTKDKEAFKEFIQSITKPPLPVKGATADRANGKNSKRAPPFSSTSVLNGTPNKLKRLKPELRESVKKEKLQNKTREHNKSSDNIRTIPKPTRSSRHTSEADQS